jgi:hypothetical protein
MLGVNDSQPMSDNEKGFAFGSDQWKATYGTRVDTLIDTLKSKGSAVYWLGLPPLGARVLDANMGLISDVQEARAQAAGVKFIDFEFAGLDDPAKTVSDFFLQPRIPVSPQYISKLIDAFKDRINNNDLEKRGRILSGVLKIKWEIFLLVEF